MDVGQIVTVLLGGSGVLGIALGGYFKRQSDRLTADVQKHKDDNEALKAQVAAQATAQATVEVAREQGETQRESQADQIDIQRGERALDRIRELQDYCAALKDQNAQLYGSAIHWIDLAGELARGYPLEERANNPLVQQILMGAVPNSDLLPKLVEMPEHLRWHAANAPASPHVAVVEAPAIVVAPPTPGPPVPMPPAAPPPTPGGPPHHA